MATSFFGGSFFGGEFFNVASVTAAADVGGSSKGAKPWQQKWRQELVELLEEKRLKPVEVPPKVARAIERVLEDAPPDDRAAVAALKAELDQLRVKPRYIEALRYEIAKQHQEAMRRAAEQRQRDEWDDEDVILLLH